MLAVIATMLALGVSQETPRLRTILPSGSVVFVENMPQAKSVTVTLVASSRGVREAPETHGWRHLLEHLLVKGPGKDLEARLESQGMAVVAETNRDTMHFSISGNPLQLQVALDGVRELLQPLRTTSEEIAREVAIVREEVALHGPAQRLSRKLWREAFGEKGLDAVGDPDVMAKATPTNLELLRKRHLATQNLVLSIAGPVDVDTTTRAAVGILPSERSPAEPESFLREGKNPAPGLDSGGEARGAVAPGWSEPETAALLAAALALASERERAWVTYTPSVQPGLVLVGELGSNSGFDDWLANLKEFEIDRLFETGRVLSESWLARYLQAPSGCALLRGMLYAQSLGAIPDAFLENVRALTPEQFRSAVERFRKGAGR
jgi:predicted Zn-dependent peptidase